MKIFKRSAVFILGFFLVTGAAFAQGQQMKQQQAAQPDSITDKELKKVAAVNKKMQELQGQAQQKVQAALAETDLSQQRFRQIMMSKRNKQMADSINITDKEQKIVDELRPKLMKIQQNSRNQMMSTLQKNEMNPQRFQTIMRAVQSNPKVMKRFQKIVKDSAKKK